MISFYILLSLIIIFQTVFYKNISNQINIYDIPDKKRKKHKYKTPVIGGINLFIVSSLLVIFDFFIVKDLSFHNSNLIKFNLVSNNFEFFGFFFVSTLFFLMGTLDDKYSINSNVKLILQVIFCIFLLSLDNNLIIHQLKFSIFEKNIYLGDFSFIFTIFCILVFINSFNMFDGMNLQIGLYSIFIFICLTLTIGVDYKLVFIIVSLLSFLILNSKGKIFIGNNGTYFLGFLISYFFLKLNYIFQDSFLKADEILIMMLVIGIDMLRVVAIRLLKGLNAFHPDNSHIHHIMIEKYNYKFTIILLSLIIFLPILYFITEVDLIFFYIIFSITYMFYIKK